jgi:hypothetical protein
MQSIVYEKLDWVDDYRRTLDGQTRKEAVSGEMTLSQLITRLDEVRNIHARLKEIAADVNSLADHLSMDLVPGAMQAAGFTTVNHEVGRVTIGTRISASMVEKDAAMQWLRDHELGSLIQETVNANTLGAQARSMIEAGEELPVDLFKTTVKPYTSITKAGALTKRKYRPRTEETE